MRKWKVLAAMAFFLALNCTTYAENREIALFTRVSKWGQLPEYFEIVGQVLPIGVVPEDFVITGKAMGWSGSDWHGFSCPVEAVESTEGGWTLTPARFPDKYFYVQQMDIICAAHPELGFTKADISRTVTPVVDDFQDVTCCDGRVTMRVFKPESDMPLPIVLVFHGYGDDWNLLSYRTAVAWAEPENQSVRPCVVIAPSINTTFYGSEIARSRIYEGVMAYIDDLVEAGFADANRIYVLGNSFGGMASFEIAEAYPNQFAAILAMCPALNYSPRGMAGLDGLTDIPVIIAQAEGDETIPVEVGKAAADALVQAGNPNVQLRIYSDKEMNACGAVKGREQTYSFHHIELAVMEDAAYAEWLFEQTRG